VEELPRDLEGDEGLSRAGREGEQDAVALRGDGLQHALDGDVLVVPRPEVPAPVLEGHGGEAVAPGVRLREGAVPQLVWGGETGDLALHAGLHVDAVHALPVAGVGEPHGQLPRVVLGLRDAPGQRLVPRLGLDHRQLAVAVHQHVVGGQRTPAPPVPLQAASRDLVLAEDAAAVHHAPAGLPDGGVDVLGSGLGFVHRQGY
jgi:hypothetical protein